MAVNYTVTSEECNGNLGYMLKKMRQKDKQTNTAYKYLKKQEYIKPSEQRRNAKHKSKQRMLDRNANNPFATDRRTDRHN